MIILWHTPREQFAEERPGQVGQHLVDSLGVVLGGCRREGGEQLWEHKEPHPLLLV